MEKRRVLLNGLSALYNSTNELRVGLTLVAILTLSACVPQTRSGSRGDADGAIVNSPNSVGAGYGRIFPDNFIILSGNKNLAPSADFSRYLGRTPVFITNDQFLNGDCEGVSPCYTVKVDQNTTPLQSASTKWAYGTTTSEFLQVHTFGHIRIITERFQTMLKEYSSRANSFNLNVPYTSAMPGALYSSKAHWLGGKTFLGYSECDLVDNASYSPSTFSICMGVDSEYSTVKLAQDPTIIYHEVGHAFQDIMMNMRNIASGTTVEKARLGSIYYDEAGSINEGVADYASYFVNKRAHMGEWALGRFSQQSRPLSEADALHAPGIEKTENERLSYPAYVNYDPNFPETPYEDVHYAGQIISHYLVALTEDLRDYCKMTHVKAIDEVFYLLAESMSELGDLSTRGKDGYATGRINHVPQFAREWQTKINPVNFRTFAQTMGRNLLKMHGNPLFGLCNGLAYPKDRIENLLDQYGLLLFKNYNENGNSSTEITPGNFVGHSGATTQISESNRRRSVLVSKNLLKLDTRSTSSQAFIFDDRASMINALQSLISSGQVKEVSNLIESDLPSNNGNTQISPGEFVGISLNLYNDSNTTMAGVQVLANDWDHTKDNKPCSTFSDNFPGSIAQGAASTATGEDAPGGCAYTTRSNGLDGDSLAPICFMQDSTSSSTVWLTQEEYRKANNDDPTICLGGSLDTKDCYFRAVKGADQAVFSKIDPKKNWGETIAASGTSPTFNFSNILFFEVNPDVKPGTTFYCRFRARFTNCEDCYTDPTNANKEDYLDHEYSGARPFQIIPFQFTVIN